MCSFHRPCRLWRWFRQLPMVPPVAVVPPARRRSGWPHRCAEPPLDRRAAAGLGAAGCRKAPSSGGAAAAHSAAAAVAPPFVRRATAPGRAAIAMRHHHLLWRRPCYLHRHSLFDHQSRWRPPLPVAPPAACWRRRLSSRHRSRSPPALPAAPPLALAPPVLLAPPLPIDHQSRLRRRAARRPTAPPTCTTHRRAAAALPPPRAVKSPAPEARPADVRATISAGPPFAWEPSAHTPYPTKRGDQ